MAGDDERPDAVERERRARERRERDRRRQQAARRRPARSTQPTRPARGARPAAGGSATATRAQHEGLVGWIVRMVVSIPAAIGALPRVAVQVLRGFVREVLAVLALVARPVLRLVPGRSGRARRAAAGAGGTATQDGPWLQPAGADDAPFTTGRRARAGREREPRSPAQQRAAAERRERLRRRLRIGVVAALLVAVVVAWLVVPASDAFRIRHVEVSGAAAVDDLQVRERIDSLLEGETVFTVDRDAVAAKVEELPFVRSARVERHLPGGLEVHVTEYEPLALAYADGDFWLVAHDGRILAKANGEAWKGRIPMITVLGSDLEPGDRIDDEPALQLLAATPRNSAVQFDVVRAGQDGLEADLATGVNVRFGRPEQLLLKVVVLDRVLELLRRKGTLDDLMYVDVSVPGKPAWCLDSTAACHAPRGPQEDAATGDTTAATDAETGAPTTPEEVGGDEAAAPDVVA